MSSGIWQALLTSAAGLIVGIMSLCTYSFCSQRINDVIVDVEAAILETANVLQSVGQIEQ
jgi:biopolymer transport protein ExbB/TolQ